MKILHDAAGEPTILEINRDESIIIFERDGSVGVSIMASPEDEEDEDSYAPPSAASMAIALIALSDPQIRMLIEQKLTDDDN